MSVLRLTHGRSSASLLPQRGGLVSALNLKAAPMSDATNQLLWMPEDFAASGSGWPGGGIPILFPFAGRVFQEGRPFQYELHGQTYHMPIHGFAYAMPWTVEHAGTDTAILSLTDTDSTRTLFPFAFELKASFTLNENSLTIGLLSRHTGTQDQMPVAFGLHPFFQLPQGAEGLDQWRLETAAATQIAVTNAGGAGKASAFCQYQHPQSGMSTLGLATPSASNLILGDHRQAVARLVQREQKFQLAMHWQGAFQYLVLWRKDGESFQCVEPWMGLPDAVSTGSGVVWLPPQASVTASVCISAASSV